VDAFDLLHDELFIRAPPGTALSPFPFRSVSSRTGLAMCLVHLRENSPFEALRALFGLGSTSTCLAVTNFVFAALLQFARTAPLTSGGVRPVSAEMLQHSREAVRRHSKGCAPADLAGIADCTSIFVTKPAGDQQLRRQLFDGEQYNDTWVKVFATPRTLSEQLSLWFPGPRIEKFSTFFCDYFSDCQCDCGPESL
jgi:hypothetical protein